MIDCVFSYFVIRLQLTPDTKVFYRYMHIHVVFVARRRTTWYDVVQCVNGP